MAVLLLGVRFVLELALVATVGVVGYQLPDRAVWGWALAAALAALTIIVWGLVLSPRRRVDLPLPVRVVIELVLFGAAAWGVVWIGQAGWGVALFVAEVVVLTSLWAMGLPPGSDAGQPRTEPG